MAADCPAAAVCLRADVVEANVYVISDRLRIAKVCTAVKRVWNVQWCRVRLWRANWWASQRSEEWTAKAGAVRVSLTG